VKRRGFFCVRKLLCPQRVATHRVAPSVEFDRSRSRSGSNRCFRAACADQLVRRGLRGISDWLSQFRTARSITEHNGHTHAPNPFNRSAAHAERRAAVELVWHCGSLLILLILLILCIHVNAKDRRRKTFNMDGQDGQDDAALRLRSAAHARLRSLQASQCAGSCTRMGVATMASLRRLAARQLSVH